MNDELNSDVRRLVDLARKARTPGAQDKLRVAERLAVPLATGAALGAAAGTAKATTGGTLLGSLAAKVAAGVAVSAVAAALVVTQQRSEPAPGAAPSHEPPAAGPTQPAEAAAPAEMPAPITPEALERSKAQRPSAPSSAPSNKPEGELAQEAALLHEAQAAWRAGQSAQALQLANQHAQRFPRSQLGSERDVLRVLSLCKLGQTQAAKQIGARLLKKSKGSPWYQSVAESCAAD